MKPGLCGTCVNARTVENREGSRFYLCELHAEDPRFSKYPVLPVVACPGYERGEQGEGTSDWVGGRGGRG